MLNSAEYRRKADECMRRAAQAIDPEVRSDYQEAARSYLQLAAEVEMWTQEDSYKEYRPR